MLKDDRIFFKKVLLFCDLCILIVAFLGGFILRNAFSDFLNEPGIYITLLPVLLALWGILLYWFGIYNAFRAKQILDVLLTVVEAAMVGGGLFGCFLFITKMHEVSRLHILYTFCLATVLICIEKVIIIYYFQYQHRRGINRKNVLIVGVNNRARQIIISINDHPEWGINIVGLVDNDARKNDTVCGHKVVGTVKEICSIIRSAIVDEVMFVIPRSWLCMIEDVLYICDVEGIRVSVAVDLFELKISKAKFRYLDKFPILTFHSAPDKLLHLLIKRLLDIIVSGFLLLMLFPVFAITAVMVKATSRGCVFFRQQRSSLNGRKFMLYKFRTMVADAESRLNELLLHNEMNGPVFKMKNDPRLTKIGGILRRFSIDELPQLWNVFKGDMSLVGPRPALPSEVASYEPWQRRRLSMRPGITCLWQANGRNKITDFNEWMRLDLEYIDKWSLLLDCKLLLKTVPVVMFGTGAK